MASENVLKDVAALLHELLVLCVSFHEIPFMCFMLIS